MTGILSPADVLGIANQTDPTKGAAEIGYNVNGVPYTVKSFLDEIANGTATPIATPLDGTETVPVSEGAGLLQTTTDNIAQLAVNIKNSESTIPIVGPSTILTFAQYNVGIINFTGLLMANSTVQLPSTPGIWIVANKTTGVYTLTLDTALLGMTALMPQGQSVLVYSDGTNVILPSAAGALVGPYATAANQLVPLNQAQTLGPAVRQTVQLGQTNSLGYASMLSIGTGFNLNLSATVMPMVVSFAAGYTNYGTTISADATAVVTLPPSNTSFVSVDYSTPTAVLWNSTLAPGQYGYAYRQSAQSVLQFNGTTGSTTFLDDFGNMWTAEGGAIIQNTMYKFGTGALGGTGTNFALNGSQWIQSSSFTSLGTNSWAIRGWVYLTAYATTYSGCFGAYNAGGYGGYFLITSAGKTALFLSSTGTTSNIAANTQGTATVALDTWTFLELTYDPVSGHYFVYVNGVLDQAIPSALVICPIMTMGVGTVDAQGGTYFTMGYIDKFEFLPYCQHPNGVAYAVPTAAPNVATPGYSSDFFSVPNMTMNQVNGPSTVALTNPMFTSKNRVYVGEAATSTTLVSTVTNYALKGQYDSGLFMVTPSMLYNKNHSLGYASFTTEARVADDIVGTNERYAVDEWYENATIGWYPGMTTRNSITIGTLTDLGITTTANGIPTTGYYRLLTRRGW